MNEAIQNLVRYRGMSRLQAEAFAKGCSDEELSALGVKDDAGAFQKAFGKVLERQAKEAAEKHAPTPLEKLQNTQGAIDQSFYADKITAAQRKELLAKAHGEYKAMIATENDEPTELESDEESA